MATFSTPENKSTQVASVTAHDVTAENPATPRRFDAEVLGFIVDLLDPELPTMEELIRKTVDALFSTHWRIRKWSDLWSLLQLISPLLLLP